MTDLLRKQQAPIGDKAWAEIETVAQSALKGQLSARKLVDFKGHFGWEFAGVNLGRLRAGKTEPIKGLSWGVRLMQPLVEIRTPFTVDLWRVQNAYYRIRTKHAAAFEKKAAAGDPDVLARTITVYTNVAAFQRALAIPGSEDVHALVVRRDGTILARARGDPDDVSWEAVASVLPVG